MPAITDEEEGGAPTAAAGVAVVGGGAWLGIGTACKEAAELHG
jgi:hypothetical protein